MRRICLCLLLIAITLNGYELNAVESPSDHGKPAHEDEQDYAIKLKSRQFTPPARISMQFLWALRTTPLSRLHAFAQFYKQPLAADKELVKKMGIELLYHVNPRLWVASVSKDFALKDRRIPSLIRWMGRVLPADKLSPDLQNWNDFPDWALTKDGRVKLSVEFFKDVSPEEAKNILANWSEEIQPWSVPNGWYVRVPAWDVAKLAVFDQVKWVELGPPPFMPFNHFSRRATFVDAVQELDLSSGVPFYLGLTGAGVQVGVWDSGIDPSHEDFMLHDATGAINGSRLIVSSGAPAESHGTQVAGIIGASGYRSALCGSTPYLYRGMAPEVELLSLLSSEWGPATSHIADAIVRYGMDLSNHSYLQTWNGRYSGVAQAMDQLVRGSVDWDGSTIAARPMVWAAGNNGQSALYSSVEGYFSIEAPAKNVITVGATIEDTAGFPHHLADYSSLGPTWDGRIKPEVVAPGDRITSTRLGTNCYTTASGTSFSSPAAAGVLSLMLQQYSEHHEINLDTDPPLPSTLKAVLIQTATDLVHETKDMLDSWENPDTGEAVLYHVGPDYATGYGAINAQAAVSLIREENLIEDVISSRDELDEYALEVAPGTSRIQFTLAWDDEAYQDAYADETLPRLVNDLELVLVAPDGARHLPWVLAPLPPAGTMGDADPITATDILPAYRGEDHLNNVEQVTVDDPMAGTWTAQVGLHGDSPGLLEEAQPYSLAGDFHDKIFFCNWNETPGSVYRIDGGAPTPIFTWAGTTVYHSAFSPDGTLYVSNANDYRLIEVVDPEHNEYREVVSLNTYLRDVAFDPAGNLYVSESSGTLRDGVIYRVDLSTRPATATPFYTVRLAQVDHYWGGDFCFGPDGELYLSNGNRIGAGIYRVDDVAGRSAPTLIYFLSGESICGIAFNRDGQFFFTNWTGGRGKIYRLALNTGKRALVRSFADRYISDVSFR